MLRRLVTRDGLLLAVILLVLEAGFSLVAQQRHGGAYDLGAGQWLLLVVGPIALAGWRRHPVAVLWVTFVSAQAPWSSRFAFVSLIVAFFLAATSGHRRAAWTAIVAGYVGSLWLIPLASGQSIASLDAALILGGWLAVLVVAAEAVRMHRERVAESRAARRVEESRRASEERLRMARELHDVIGHNISLINVQAAMGLDLIDAQPEQARAALSAIKTVSKDALGELRTLLAALRQAADEAPRSPTPGLDRLGELVALTRAAGVSVSLDESGTDAPLPASVGLAAYRIVQEALTNVARHAPGASAAVRIRQEPGALSVEVADSGAPGGSLRASSVPGSGSGHAEGPLEGRAEASVDGTGIAGMRERAVALGGVLVAGPQPGGGFRVAATLPVGARP